MKSASLACFLVALAGLVGCGPDLSHLPPTVPAEGVVTLDGQPVDGATLTFIADSGTYHATGTTDAAGKFKLRAFQEKEGAVPGSYKVEVNKTVVTGGSSSDTGGEGAPINVQFGLPKKYASMTTSGLTATIPEGGTTTLAIDLKSK